MTETEVLRWFDRLSGAIVGLAMGLAFSVGFTWRLIGLGARMGAEVLKASRLSSHVSREYQNMKRRVERLERLNHIEQGDDIEEESR